MINIILYQLCSLVITIAKALTPLLDSTLSLSLVKRSAMQNIKGRYKSCLFLATAPMPL
jgi:hypothetical protein